MSSAKTRCRFTLLGLLALLALGLWPLPGIVDDEAELKALREQIQTLQRSLAQKQGQRDKTNRELSRFERQIGEASRKLTDLKTRRQGLQEKQQVLEARMTGAESSLDRQRSALARQLRASYVTGRQENLRLLLSQESPASLGRMVVYYDYLNRARSNRINRFRDRVEELAGMRRENNRLVEETRSLEEQQQAALISLESARADRATVLASLTTEISKSGSQLQRLQAQEQELAELVLELQALLQDLPADSESRFSQVQGQLFWPVEGRLEQDYGQPKAGNLTWNGVLLAATRGETVRALFHGRIVFADWLAGMGLLVVIDHGEGYMSLYGHNEAVLKEPGDWVGPGERIALVGDSGGLPEPALYLEIRRDGIPQNPRRWIGRRRGD